MLFKRNYILLESIRILQVQEDIFLRFYLPMTDENPSIHSLFLISCGVAGAYTHPIYTLTDSPVRHEAIQLHTPKRQI